MPFEKKFARMGLHARMDAEYPRSVPIQSNEENNLAGAHIYREHCAVCHGAAGQQLTSVAKGMYPRPPQVLDPKHMVSDDPPGETYWKVSNGIRLTGMPSFRESLSSTQMWQVSVMLANADKLPPSVNASAQSASSKGNKLLRPDLAVRTVRGRIFTNPDIVRTRAPNSVG